MSGRELISRTTRGLFRDLMTDSTLGAIGAAFQDEGFAPNPDSTYDDVSSRRILTQQYLAAVAWSDIAHVERVLRVFERLVHGFDPQYSSKFLNSLRRDGYMVDEQTGHIRAIGPRFSLSSLSDLNDPLAIREQLDRIQRAIVDDPALAVGSAKELIESTAKVVLTVSTPIDSSRDQLGLTNSPSRIRRLTRSGRCGRIHASPQPLRRRRS